MSFLLTLPLLLAFLFAVVDLGRTVFLGMALEDAAYAACRAVCASGADGVADVEAAREAALAASPALGAEGLRLDASVNVGEREEEAYAHRLYDAKGQSFIERPSVVAHRAVRVHLELQGGYLTPIGSLLAAAGEPEGFVFAASASGERDETVEGGSW